MSIAPYMARAVCRSPAGVTLRSVNRRGRAVPIGAMEFAFSQARATYSVGVSGDGAARRLDYQISDERARPVARGTVRLRPGQADDVVGLLVCPKGFKQPGTAFHGISPMGFGWELAISVGKAVRPLYRPPDSSPEMANLFGGGAMTAAFGAIGGRDRPFGPDGVRYVGAPSVADAYRVVIFRGGGGPDVLGYEVRDERSRRVRGGRIRVRPAGARDRVGLVMCPDGYARRGTSFYTLEPMGLGWRLALAIGRPIEPLHDPGRGVPTV